MENRDWLMSLLQVDREYKITGIRDASVKLLIKLVVKDEEEEADVLNMVKLLSSPHDQLLARLDLSTQTKVKQFNQYLLLKLLKQSNNRLYHFMILYIPTSTKEWQILCKYMLFCFASLISSKVDKMSDNL